MIFRALAAAVLDRVCLQLSSPPSARSSQRSTPTTPPRWRCSRSAVNINSGTQNFAGVRAVGDVFRNEFDALGFKTTWVDGARIQARRAPDRGPSRDGTANHPDRPSRHRLRARQPVPEVRAHRRPTATGPGVIDMKGGDVIIVAALKALKAAGVLDRHERGRRDDRRRGGLRRSAGGRARRRWSRRRRGRSMRSASRTVPAIRGSRSRRAAAPRRGSSRSQARPGHSSQIFRPDSATAPTTSWRGSSTASVRSSPAKST